MKVICLRFDRDGLIVFIIAFCYVSVLSSLSFIYGSYYPLDSTIYQIIGKGWTEGRIPYIDLWDQKGPLLYSIQALGYAMTGNRYGLFFIEICIFAVSFSQLLSFYRHHFSYRVSYLLLFVTICHLSQLTASGNTIEEYILPLLLPAFFFLFSWVEKASTEAQVSHPWKWAFLYGLILAFSFLTRATNAVGICIAACIVFCYLVSRGEWKNILKNTLAFFGGVIVLLAPFVIYFYCKDALEEMFYATILYNIDYTSNVFHEGSSWYTVISFLLSYLNTYGLILIALILFAIDREYRFSHFMWFAISLVTMAYFMRTFLYEHYAIISVPYFAIMLIELKRLMFLLSKKWQRKATACTCLAACIVLVANGAYQVFQEIPNMNQPSKYAFSFDKIMEDEKINKEDFLCYNLHPSVYMHYDMTPSCRFFALQDWYSQFSESVRPRIRKSFELSMPKYILVKGQNTVIDELLKAKYSPLKETDMGVLYRRNIE